MPGPSRPSAARWSRPAPLGALVLGGRCPCGRPGPSPCGTCAATARAPAPGPTPPGLDLLLVGRAYAGITREVVARVKYRNERAAVDWLLEPLVTALAAHGVAAGDLTVTWAPTTDARRRARGFDHGAVLAAALARSIGRGSRSTLRRLDALPQTGRDRAARIAGPRFEARRAVRGPVLLVDDVVTTGSTVSGAARALRAAGASAVIGACVARAGEAGVRAAGHGPIRHDSERSPQGAIR